MAAGNIGLDAVGKISLGSMATDSFGRYLYVMALGNRTLYRLPIDPDAAPLTDTGEHFSQQVPLTDCPGGNPLDARPFSVTTYDWAGTLRLYVGVTCTAESTGNAADLRLLIYEVEPGYVGV